MRSAERLAAKHIVVLAVAVGVVVVVVIIETFLQNVGHFLAVVNYALNTKQFNRGQIFKKYTLTKS